MRQRTPVAILLSPRPAVVAAVRRTGARTVVVAPGPSEPSDREGAVRPARWTRPAPVPAGRPGAPPLRPYDRAPARRPAGGALPVPAAAPVPAAGPYGPAADRPAAYDLSGAPAGARVPPGASRPAGPADPAGSRARPEDPAGRLDADWRDHARLVAALARLRAVREGRAAVFGFGGQAAALAAARANEALGLPGATVAAVTALTDKAALRARANTLHPGRPVSFVRCGHALLLPFLAGLIGYPCVVKPRAGTGGEGVRALRGPADATAAVHDYPAVTDLLVEELLEGPEITALTVSRAGRHRVLGLLHRLPARDGARTAALGHRAPVPLPPDTAGAVRAHVRAVLDLAGHRDGPARTELVLTRHGPRLVEADPHPGGPETAGLLLLAHGADVYAATAAAALDLPEPPGRPRAGHAGLRYVDLPPGHRLDALPGALASARATVPGLVAAGPLVPTSGTVGATPTGDGHHAYLLAGGATAASVHRVLERAAALVASPRGRF
ncbi:ATP-grasp domain-containing protein [Streptomyces sp. NPDC012888]|uniref:ATP-grasp domain-containing protein n=1 Tax=Streptomyces sp. NPDC012888 TaxID=3364855 RepID=UPI0036BF1951